MYDPVVTAAYLQAQQDRDPSFQAAYHSFADCEAMTGVLVNAWDPDEGVLTRKLSNDEITFIDNERLICTHDFLYYCSRYFRVKDFETEKLTNLRLNIAQRIVIDSWAEMEAKQWAIMMMQLKARRLRRVNRERGSGRSSDAISFGHVGVGGLVHAK